MIIKKFIIWSLILRHKLLIPSSVCKILCVYLFYEKIGCITYSFLFYNVFMGVNIILFSQIIFM